MLIHLFLSFFPFFPSFSFPFLSFFFFFWCPFSSPGVQGPQSPPPRYAPDKKCIHMYWLQYWMEHNLQLGMPFKMWTQMGAILKHGCFNPSQAENLQLMTEHAVPDKNDVTFSVLMSHTKTFAFFCLFLLKNTLDCRLYPFLTKWLCKGHYEGLGQLNTLSVDEPGRILT